MRTKLTPTFTSGKMKMMFNTVTHISDLMVSQLQNEPNLEMIEMKNVLANFTTVISGFDGFDRSLTLMVITGRYWKCRFWS
jgi:cytochrome P450 family 6